MLQVCVAYKKKLSGNSFSWVTFIFAATAYSGLCNPDASSCHEMPCLFCQDQFAESFMFLSAISIYLPVFVDRH